MIEETKVRELEMEAVRRAIKYEEAARNFKKKIVVECLRELGRGRKREESKWEKKRSEVLEKTGWSKEEREMKRENMKPEEIAEVLDKLEEKKKEKRRKCINE